MDKTTAQPKVQQLVHRVPGSAGSGSRDIW